MFVTDEIVGKRLDHHVVALLVNFHNFLFPQIALAIGVLTSNRRGGWCTSSKIGRGAVAGCHCWVPLLGIGGGWCRSWLPLMGAIAGCHCWAAIAGCRTRWQIDVVTLLGAIAGLPLLGIGAGVGVYVGGLDVVPLLAAIAGCHCWG